jgi:DNA polymerase-1
VLEKDIIELEKKIHEIAGVRFNIDSPKQLGEVLFTNKNPLRRSKTKPDNYQPVKIFWQNWRTIILLPI